MVVTGACGFIGSNFVRLALSELPGTEVVAFDKLTYAGNLENLHDVEGLPNYTFVRGDITAADAVARPLAEPTDAVIHCAPVTTGATARTAPN